MCWSRTLLLLFFASPVWALEGYIIGVGADADTEDAIAASLSAELGLTKDTWLSMAVASNKVDLPLGITLDTLYADVGIDHWFDPVGVRVGVAYWGDSDILDSVDYRASLYWRGDKFSVAGNYEFRDFSFDLFRRFPSGVRDIEFHADGVGLSARVDLSDSVDLSFSAMQYDYNVNLGIAESRPIADFLSVSRLSLLNSLIDYRGRVAVGVDVGPRRLSLDYATWKGEVGGRVTNSVTLRFLTPMGQRSDVEFSLGVDRSKGFGSVAVFSVFLFFYG